MSSSSRVTGTLSLHPSVIYDRAWWSTTKSSDSAYIMRTSPSKLTVNPFSELWVCAQCAFKCVHICVCEWVMNGDSQSTASVLQLQSSTTALVQVEENMTKWKCFLLASMKTKVKNIISMNTEVNCIADKICMTLSRQFAHSVLPLLVLLFPPSSLSLNRWRCQWIST